MSILGVVGDVVGGLFGANSAKQAGDAAADAAKEAAKVQWKMYDQTRTDLTPYRDVGPGALNALTGLVTPKMSQDQRSALWGQMGGYRDRIDALDAKIAAARKSGARASGGGSAPGNVNFSSAVDSGAMAAYQKALARYEMEKNYEDGPSGAARAALERARNALTGSTDPTVSGGAPAGNASVSGGGNSELDRLLAQRRDLVAQKKDTRATIEAGKQGMELRDPYEGDPISDRTPTRTTNALWDTPYGYKGGKIDVGWKEKYKFNEQDYLNPDDFETSPGYQFRLEQGLDSVANDAAARGLRYSGAVMKGMNDYAQGMASDEYANWFNQGLARGATDRANFDTTVSGLNSWVNNQATQKANSRANAALAMQGYGAWNALRDSNQLWNYGRELDAYNRNYGQRRDTISDLFSLTGIGQNAAAQTGTAGMSAASNAGNAAMAGGQAMANAKIMQGNAWTNALNNVGTNIGQMQENGWSWW